MSTKSKPVEMAPVLQGLKEYLANHYMDDLLEEIKAAMSLNLVEGLDVDCKDSEIVIDTNSTELLRAEPWRVDRTNLIADCKMRIKFGLPKDGSKMPHGLMFRPQGTHYVVETSNRFGEPLKPLISKGLRVTGVRKFPSKRYAFG